MKSKELLFEIDQLRIKMDYEIGNQYIEESIELIEQFKKEVAIDFLTWLEENPAKEMIIKIVDEYLTKQQ